MKLYSFPLFSFAILILLIISCAPKETADMVILNAKIATVDKNFAIKEAVAVKNRKILFVGSSEDVKKYITETTEVIDANNLFVLPGLIDAHGHLVSLGTSLTQLNTNDCKTYEAIIQRVKRAVQKSKPGDWIIGGRWDQTKWESKAFPIHDALSAVSPNNPVYLSRTDGNSALVNKKALEIAGIATDTENPSGGIIIRKTNGLPTGVLINRAMNLVKNFFPKESLSDQKEQIKKAIAVCNESGLTGVHEAGISIAEVDAFKALVDEDKLDMRVYAMLGDQKNPEYAAEDLVQYFKDIRIDNYGDHLFSLKSLKLYFDGALGSRGAAFFDPYHDDPTNTGLLRIPPDYITRVAKAALQADMQVCTHAIGIRGNRLCLDAYEDALKAFPKEAHRFRIEHAQVVRDQDIQKFVDLNVIPSVQPTHCTSDKGFVEDRIGTERAKGAYAWRSFIDAGLVMPCGSDFPVESTNPLHGIYALVSRKDTNQMPEGGWYPNQRITIEEAIKGFTIWAAYGAFDEELLGSIEVGKYADFTILDSDLLSISAEEILETRVLYTIVGGQVKYKR
jgi:predicted amidohydrolase YtcJ